MNASVVMNTGSTASAWLKIVAGIGVIWYAFGLLQFWLGYSMDTAVAVETGAITAAHGAAIDATPFGIWLAFAVASGLGLIGSMFLFMCSATAKPVFLASFACALVYYGWMYGLSGTGGDRPSEEIGIAIVVVAATFGFVLLSRRAT